SSPRCWPFPSSRSTTATGFTDEPQVGPRGADPPLRGSRGAVRCLVPEPVRAGGQGRKPGRGRRGFRRVDRAGRLRPVVFAQDEDAQMKGLADQLPNTNSQGPKQLTLRVGDWDLAVDTPISSEKLASALRLIVTTVAVLIVGSSRVLACPQCFG